MFRYAAALFVPILLATPAMAEAEDPLIGVALSYADTLPKHRSAIVPVAAKAHGSAMHASHKKAGGKSAQHGKTKKKKH